jgi:hypothetical protein
VVHAAWCRYKKTLECYQYAQFLEYKDKKIAEAAPIYNQLCDERNHAQSCLSAGMIALNTKGAVGGSGAEYGPLAFKRFDQVRPSAIDFLINQPRPCVCGMIDDSSRISKHCTPRTLTVADGRRSRFRFFVLFLGWGKPQACSQGEAKGCQNAGLLMKEGGHGVSKDVPGAVRYFDKACEGGERNGCYYMGLMHLSGQYSTYCGSQSI